MARAERFSLPPRSVSIPGGKPRLSMMDRQIAAIRAEQERYAARINTREELFNDLTDFSYLSEVDEFGLPYSTPYQVPDYVPDVLPVQKEDPAQDPEKKDSVSNEGSGKEPSSGTE